MALTLRLVGHSGTTQTNSGTAPVPSYYCKMELGYDQPGEDTTPAQAGVVPALIKGWILNIWASFHHMDHLLRDDP